MHMHQTIKKHKNTKIFRVVGLFTLPCDELVTFPGCNHTCAQRELLLAPATPRPSTTTAATIVTLSAKETGLENTLTKASHLQFPFWFHQNVKIIEQLRYPGTAAPSLVIHGWFWPRATSVSTLRPQKVCQAFPRHAQWCSLGPVTACCEQPAKHGERHKWTSVVRPPQRYLPSSCSPELWLLNELWLIGGMKSALSYVSLRSCSVWQFRPWLGMHTCKPAWLYTCPAG